MNKKERLTIQALTDELKRREISVRYNVVTNEIQFDGRGDEIQEHILSTLPAILHSDLGETFTNVSRATVEDYLLVIATRNRFNPVLDMLDLHKWDGVDRLTTIIDDVLHIGDDSLSKSLFTKWCLQSVALLHNNAIEPYGGDGMLVLIGSQGSGKTRFTRWLGVSQEFYREGATINSRDKDTLRRIVTSWISEIGELDRTIKKSDNGDIKAFVTASFDSYRLPYGHHDQNCPRRSSMVATVNDPIFITDQSGSRRYWCINVDRIDLKKLMEIDAIEFWRQILNIWRDNDPQCFRLTESERIQLQARNTAHTDSLPGEDEVLDIIAQDTELSPTTISNWVQLYPQLRKYTTKQVAKVLDKLGYKTECKRVDGKPGRWRTLPTPSGFKP